LIQKGSKSNEISSSNPRQDAPDYKGLEFFPNA
jgi:hypothetical protein